MKTSYQFYLFRIISYIEGLSYLFLVFLAMPLKYLENNIFLMKILGMGHGILFILFCFSIFLFKKKYEISKEVFKDYFIYSLSPFGYLLIENNIKEKFNLSLL
ncbi:DUF3817 domain-containing protein [Aliarcobacter butzleri]|uniref:DUF3817 domain-containing protein n=1 Tax=Aliarcobacter butzleri TaxID=28197 RepID=UPI00102DC597|nr:DUF3817 domain-containing protein [Aliarcobacter butzleri]RZV18634.1 DUF3817 domain-containing protein [Aliarcobacter butzleri]